MKKIRLVSEKSSSKPETIAQRNNRIREKNKRLETLKNYNPITVIKPPTKKYVKETLKKIEKIRGSYSFSSKILEQELKTNIINIQIDKRIKPHFDQLIYGVTKCINNFEKQFPTDSLRKYDMTVDVLNRILNLQKQRKEEHKGLLFKDVIPAIDKIMPGTCKHNIKDGQCVRCGELSIIDIH